jgi:hypothetical protein
MTSEEITNRLLAIADSDHFMADAYELTDALSAAHGGIETVEPILRFMEANPSIDYGMPGPLVHYMEKFYRKGYEQKLVESVERNPTSHTVGMLNRLINGTRDAAVKRKYIGVMERARLNPRADEDTVRRASHYLERIASLWGDS